MGERLFCFNGCPSRHKEDVAEGKEEALQPLRVVREEVRADLVHEALRRHPGLENQPWWRPATGAAAAKTRPDALGNATVFC